jgi:hypothetical protein
MKQFHFFYIGEPNTTLVEAHSLSIGVSLTPRSSILGSHAPTGQQRRSQARKKRNSVSLGSSVHLDASTEEGHLRIAYTEPGRACCSQPPIKAYAACREPGQG